MDHPPELPLSGEDDAATDFRGIALGIGDRQAETRMKVSPEMPASLCRRVSVC